MVAGKPGDHMTLKERLKTSDFTLGTWVGGTDPLVIEAVAQSDFEFLIIDCEHGLIDRSGLVLNLVVAKAAGKPAIVRLADSDVPSFMSALDGGADGILLPRVETVAEVRRAVALCKYPPVGQRGFGPLRAARYYRDIDGYTARANDDVIVMVQIETASALAAIDEILGIEGLDGILVGRNDLAGSLGLERSHGNAELNAIAAGVLARARRRGMISAIATGGGGETLARLRDMNANMVAAGGHIEYLVRGIDSYLSEVRGI
jgi:2-keto-3-deoxy-L-rhamnonate aldolase RhmA